MSRLAAVGVDPGARWTAAVLRVGDRAINGFTLGPVGADGMPARKANDDLGAAALDRYTDRIGKHLDDLCDLSVELGYGEPLIGVERFKISESYRHIPTYAWLISWTVYWYVKGRYNGVKTIPNDGNGYRHLERLGGTGKMDAYYPADLCRRRPAGWWANEAPRTPRDHERAAYDVAGRVISPDVAAAAG